MARKKRSRRPQLTDRDFRIFDHLRRYRLTTREILHQLFFSDLDLTAFTKVTSRLVDGGYLAGKNCMVPTPTLSSARTSPGIWAWPERGPRDLVRKASLMNTAHLFFAFGGDSPAVGCWCPNWPSSTPPCC